MSVIATNMASLSSQNIMSRNQSVMERTMSRISSGLRVLGAKDDAAGLSISQSMTSQIRGNLQAARNANDGISLFQIAEGALDEIQTNLQRARELAVQAINDSNGATERTALNTELSQIISEVNRVATQTKFNGQLLLDGSFSSKVFQVGADYGQTITASSIDSNKTADLGKLYTASITGTTVSNSAFAASDLTINGIEIGTSTNYSSSDGRADTSAYSKAIAINNSGVDGVTATANSHTTWSGTLTAGLTLNNSDLVINGVNISVTSGTDASAQVANIVSAINAQSAVTGVTSTSSNDAYSLTAADGRNIIIAVNDEGASAEESGYASGSTVRSTITLAQSSGTSGDLTLGGNTETDAGFTNNQTSTLALSGSALSAQVLTTRSGAETALQAIDSAIESVSSTRATLGAQQNRFESVVRNNQTIAENNSAARSRIRDADVAMEMAEFSKLQVLQQAGTAMLRQANQLPQSVLSLLQ